MATPRNVVSSKISVACALLVGAALLPACETDDRAQRKPGAQTTKDAADLPPPKVTLDPALMCQARARYEEALNREGFTPITTEITEAGEFYYAEEHHQQYLAKNPEGYCGLGGTGVICPSP